MAMIVRKKNAKPLKPQTRYYALSKYEGNGNVKKDGKLPCIGCDEGYNFECKNNMLLEARGFGKTKLDDGSVVAKLPDGVGDGKLFFVRTVANEKGSGKLIFCHDGGLEMLDLISDARWQHLDIDEKVASVTDYNYMGRDLVLLGCVGGTTYVLENQTLTKVLTDKVIVQLLSHNERIFALVKGGNNSVWFSDVFDPFDWEVSLSGGGYLECDNSQGVINKLVSMGDYLYLFCDYGIYRLTCYSLQSQFELKKVYSSGEKILGESVASTQNKIIFCTKDNAYSYDYYGVKRLNVDLETMTSQNNSIKSATAKQNQVYIVTQNAEIIIYDVEKDNYCVVSGYQTGDLTSVEAKNLSAIVARSKLCEELVMMTEQGEDYLTQCNRSWKIKDVDFGEPNRLKNIRYAEYKVSALTTLSVTADGINYQFPLTQRNNKVAINVKGKNFDFELFNDTATVKISPIELRIDYLR
ncbi:MAG: hypothetical protein ACI4M5_04780 [Christensenellales bacterium]